MNLADELVMAVAALYGEVTACAVDLTPEEIENLTFVVGTSPYILLNDINIATARLRCIRQIANLTHQ